MMSRQATTVAVKAEGATNQKSWGEPNQQRGVMKAAQNNINLKIKDFKIQMLIFLLGRWGFYKLCFKD